MNHEQWLEMAEIHAMGALDGEDLLAFQAHLQTNCAECQAVLSQTESLLSAMPASLPVILPPAQLKEVLMQKIEDPLAVPTPVAAKTSPLLVPIFAGVSLIATGLVLWVTQPVWLPAPAASPGALPAAASVAVPAPPAAPLHDAGMLELLKDPEVKIIEFKDPVTGEKILAKLYWNPNACGGCLTVEGLSKTEAGKVYEFWAITGSTPVPGGTFTVDENGKAHLDIRPMGEIKNFDKFAVTIEPEGGAPLPTGPMKLLSF